MNRQINWRAFQFSKEGLLQGAALQQRSFGGIQQLWPGPYLQAEPCLYRGSCMLTTAFFVGPASFDLSIWDIIYRAVNEPTNKLS